MATTIENITNPGQPLAHGDQYKLIDDNGTFKYKLFLTEPGTVFPLPAIRTITTQAFYRRMTQGELASMRAGTSDVTNVREDLERSSAVDLDGTIEAQLQSIPSFNQTRIDELLVDGTPEETETG